MVHEEERPVEAAKRPDNWKDEIVSNFTQPINNNYFCREDIWKDLTRPEKLLWTRFFNAFNVIIHFPAGVHPDKSTIRAVAKNMANQAVWVLRQIQGDKLTWTRFLSPLQVKQGMGKIQPLDMSSTASEDSTTSDSSPSETP